MTTLEREAADYAEAEGGTHCYQHDLFRAYMAGARSMREQAAELTADWGQFELAHALRKIGEKEHPLSL